MPQQHHWACEFVSPNDLSSATVCCWGSFMSPCSCHCCCWGGRRVWLWEGACGVALHCSAAPGDTAPLWSPHGHITGLPTPPWPWQRGLLTADSVPGALLFHLQRVLTGDLTGGWETQHEDGIGLVTLLWQTCKWDGCIFHGSCCLINISAGP